MRTRLRRLPAVLLTALLLSSAAAPAAASTIYPPTDACSASSANPGAGETFTVGCSAATFGADEPVTITVEGENGAAVTFGIVRTAISTATTVRTSDASGALAPVEITLPSNARGIYNIALVSPSSAGGISSVAVANADGTLSVTGLDQGRLLGVWVGGGALVAAGAVILGTIALRRHRAQTDD